MTPVAWTEAQCAMFIAENHDRKVRARAIIGSQRVEGMMVRVGYPHGDERLVGITVGLIVLDPATITFADGMPERAPSASRPLKAATRGVSHCGAAHPCNDRWICSRPPGHPPTVHAAHGFDTRELDRWPATASSAVPAPAPVVAPVPAARPDMTPEQVARYIYGDGPEFEAEARRALERLTPPTPFSWESYIGLPLSQVRRMMEE